MGRHRKDNPSPKKEDVTLSRIELDQLILDQKMEALSRFARRVVHDFNNLLTPVTLNSRLLLTDLSKEDASYVDINDIFQAGNKATNFLRQISVASCVKEFKPKKENINDVISNLGKRLCDVVGEKIEFVTHLDPTLQDVKADFKLLQELILQLVENACQAMPDGGKLTIETKNLKLQKDPSFVSLTVCDTGGGIDPKIHPFIFDPFFTTAEDPKGRGLGLAIVYQIVKKHQGQISFTSQPGQGTRFALHFPALRPQSYVH